MTFISAQPIGIKPRDSKGREPGFQLQEHRIAPVAKHIGEDVSTAVINGMPQPALMCLVRVVT